jgi:hypothetical protein
MTASNFNRATIHKDSVFLSKAALSYLRCLQRDLVLVPVDKAANNVAFVCKRLYTRVLRDELEKSATDDTRIYETAEEGDVVVVERHVHILTQLYSLEPSVRARQVAYLYWLPKLHKNPPSQRFIAGAARCTTTELSKLLSDCLLHVLDTLREKDDAGILKSAVRRFFVVKGFEEVSDFLFKFPRTCKSGRSRQSSADCGRLQTGDFSTMYTTIPHKDLIDKLSMVFEEAWKWLAETRDVESNCVSLRWTRGADKPCTWDVSKRRQAQFQHSKNVHTFTKLELAKATAWLIENTYLLNGDTCRRQRVGIPMGTNCAPAIANLYLYAYESAYIDKLVETSQLEKAILFHMSFRYIDDVLSVDNPHFLNAISSSAEHGGLYPAALSLNLATVSDNEVHFLGMSIKDTVSRGKLCIEVFDKRKEFPFRVCRYPFKQSLIPEYIAYGVFMGLLHRYYRICTRYEDFCSSSSLLATTLVDQGWDKSRLYHVFRKFLHTRLGLKWRVELKNILRRFATQTR